MKIVVNGETRDVRAPDLAALLAELDYPPELVATAVNETFRPRQGARGPRADGRRPGGNPHAPPRRLRLVAEIGG